MHESTEQQATNLQTVLQQQVEAHEQLLTLLQRKRDGLRTADAKSVMACCALENEKVQLISELEKQRLCVIAALTLSLDPQAAAPLRLADLAEQLPEPVRGRLLVLRQQLVERMTRVAEASTVARRAAEALGRHMHGLVQSIGAISTGVATYGQRGKRPAGATAISTISVTA